LIKVYEGKYDCYCDMRVFAAAGKSTRVPRFVPRPEFLNPNGALNYYPNPSARNSFHSRLPGSPISDPSRF